MNVIEFYLLPNSFQVLNQISQKFASSILSIYHYQVSKNLLPRLRRSGYTLEFQFPIDPFI